MWLSCSKVHTYQWTSIHFNWPFWTWSFIFDFQISLSIIFLCTFVQQKSKINDNIKTIKAISFITSLLFTCPINGFHLSSCCNIYPFWFLLLHSISYICAYMLYVYVYIHICCMHMYIFIYVYIYIQQMYWCMCTHTYTHIQMCSTYFLKFKSSWKCLAFQLLLYDETHQTF